MRKRHFAFLAMVLHNGGRRERRESAGAAGHHDRPGHTATAPHVAKRADCQTESYESETRNTFIWGNVRWDQQEGGTASGRKTTSKHEELTGGGW